MANSEVTLFDLSSVDVPGKNVCWSLNPWKTRFALNYKGIPYTTRFLDYPELRSVLGGLGVPPNPNATSPLSEYTSPSVQLPDGRIIMDSKLIAAELEKLYPSPSLHLDSPELTEVYAELPNAFRTLRNTAIPRIGRNVLGGASQEYFQRTRLEAFGMTLDELEATKGGPEVVARAGEHWKSMAAIVERNDKGPFVLGDEVSYADFVIMSAIIFARRAGEDLYNAIVGENPSLARLYDACEPWMKRDDH